MSSIAAAADHGSAGSGYLLVILLAVAAMIAWRASLKRNPYTHCSTCRGRGRHYGLLFTHAFRLCGSCGGTGRQLRHGADALTIDATTTTDQGRRR